jgi:2-methylisocitrate lyase-like PEP mutase family enzyme
VTAGSLALAERAERLRALHHGPAPLILANAWDVASAVAVARAGASAIATTSSGVAASLGYPDGEAIPGAEMLAAIARIATAVSLPVTADMEGGYGLDAPELVAALIGAGAVGLNLEDTDRADDPSGLVDAEVQAGRLAAIRRAASAVGVPVVINARIDVFLRGSGSLEARLEEAIRRAVRYVAAGADCVFPIGLVDAEAIGRVVRAVAAPVNVLLLPDAPPIATLAELGVRRISVGGGLARHAMGDAEAVARRLSAGDGSALAEHAGEDEFR